MQQNRLIATAAVFDRVCCTRQCGRTALLCAKCATGLNRTATVWGMGGGGFRIPCRGQSQTVPDDVWCGF